MTDEDRTAKAQRVRGALELNAKALEEAEAAVDDLRTKRRDLILLAVTKTDGEPALLTYVATAECASISKPQVYKIVRDGYREAPLRERALETASA